jgi:hypothetical protein
VAVHDPTETLSLARLQIESVARGVVDLQAEDVSGEIWNTEKTAAPSNSAGRGFGSTADLLHETGTSFFAEYIFNTIWGLKKMKIGGL